MKELIICRCEEVSLSAIEAAIRCGACTPQEMKLRTRAGMGICQGRTCRPLLERLAAECGTGSSLAVGLSHRFPVRPVFLADLVIPRAKGEES